MKKTGILSGEQLVLIGATKHNANLPELGVKNVIPSGSWLENKQIQAAIENRKHLLGIEKIEKRGVLSKAEWDEELGLAEVTQIVGGHWQYLGHADKKKTYLRPEEALFLLETNCLQLTYNDVTVSVQQAYTLLLRGQVTLMHYKVFASLSRVGYKILRHEYKDNNSNKENTEQGIKGDNVEVENENGLNSKEVLVESLENGEGNEDNNQNNPEESMELNTESDKVTNSHLENTKMDVDNANDIVASTNGIEDKTVHSSEASTSTQAQTTNTNKRILSRKEIKLKKFKERKYSTLNGDTIAHCFEKLPEMVSGKVELKAPDESLLPRNVFPNCTTYSIDIDKVKVRNVSPSERRPYSASDEVNGSHIRRIRGPTNDDTNSQYTNINRNARNQHNNQPYFSLFNFQRWRNPQFDMMFQRTFMNFPQRFFPQFQRFSQPQFQRFQHNFSYRQRTNLNTNNRTNSSARRCENYTKEAHLNLIKYLIHRLKSLLGRGQNDLSSLTELLRQLQQFNTKHGTRLRLTKTFDIADESELVINIEDEDSPPAKKPKVDDSKYKENLKCIKDLSKRLAEMAKNGEAYARHRRALSNAIKIFNKAYNSELFINDDNEIGNKKEIVIDSSDSDCVIEELPVKSKKLRNPFNILKRRSLDVTLASKNEARTSNEPVAVKDKYEDSVVDNFKKWLPSETDFGRPEIITQTDSYNFTQDAQTELFLFEYLKEYNFNYENWCEVKTSFWESLKESALTVVETESDTNNTSSESLLSTEDFTDLPSMLEKIRVIRNCKDILCDSSLSIDFDVYNRDVQNFRKTCPPKPHYRVICIDEQSPIPSGVEVATLHAKYTDHVPILFAIVGPGSINYLQMNPSDIPVYLPNME